MKSIIRFDFRGECKACNTVFYDQKRSSRVKNGFGVPITKDYEDAFAKCPKCHERVWLEKIGDVLPVENG
jgi:uncharacterized protein with PIN domain